MSGRTVETVLTVDILATTMFQIEIQKIPNPNDECTVDMNEMHIQVFNASDRSTVFGTSFYLINRASSVSFSSYANYLQVNNGSII